MRRPHLPKTSEGASRAAIAGAMMLVFAVFLWLIGYVLVLADDLDDMSAALGVANQRLVENGEKPVEPPVAGEQGVPGAAGTEGRPPSTAEILGAVTAYCADNACRGPAGSNVTPAQVAAAVLAYCNDRGECRGPRGGAGRNGADGAGGPPPTDAQVAAAVATFCADGRCRGPAGPVGATGQTGDAGAAGSDGRGIASIDCESTPQLELTVTYTDGTRQTVSCTAIGNSG